MVRHRIDGLETSDNLNTVHFIVRHRIDGLEMS